MKKLYFIKVIALSILICSASLLTNAQAPSFSWQKTFGGSGDDFGGNMIKTSDGNYIVCGTTTSSDGDFSINRGDYDAFAIKFDADGNFIWSKTYGGSAYDDFTNIIETDNGGFLITGTTASNDGDVSGNHGGEDIWLVRLSSTGNIVSQKCFGGSGDEYNGPSSLGLIKTHDHNYMFAAVTNSSDGDVPQNLGGNDGWVVKINRHGNIIFSKIYGGSADDDITSIMELNDSKYVIAGTTHSIDGTGIGNHGDADYMLIKIGTTGNVKWSRCYGGSGSDIFHEGVGVFNNIIALGGSTTSSDGDVTGFHGGADSWVIKINAQNGNIKWANCFGTALTETLLDLLKTNDGYVFVDAVDSAGYCCFETWDAQAAKISNSGNEEWSKIFGGSDFDQVNTGLETDDDGLLLNCVTTSTDGDITNNHGGPEDGWLVKLKSNHNRFSINSEGSAINSTNNLNIFPNPFSNSTTISFSLSQSQNVSLNIYDVNGRLIKTLANNVFEKGKHSIEWNVERVNAGIYFLQIQSTEFSKTERLILTK